MSLRVVVVLSHSPLEGAYFQESQRTAMMFAGLGHTVDYVLVDAGVLSLLEQEGYTAGLRKLGRLRGIDGLRLHALGSSLKNLLHGADAGEVPLLSDGEFADMLTASKVVVF